MTVSARDLINKEGQSRGELTHGCHSGSPVHWLLLIAIVYYYLL